MIWVGAVGRSRQKNKAPRLRIVERLRGCYIYYQNRFMKEVTAYMNIELHNCDCLELMANIPSESIDMILCDLPYGTTRNTWDSIIPLEPCGGITIVLSNPTVLYAYSRKCRFLLHLYAVNLIYSDMNGYGKKLTLPAF